MSDTTTTQADTQTDTVLYHVMTGDHVRERTPRRRDALRRARTLSSRGGRVSVQRSDGWEHLIYRGGELLESNLVTHDRRRRDRRMG